MYRVLDNLLLEDHGTQAMMAADWIFLQHHHAAIALDCKARKSGRGKERSKSLHDLSGATTSAWLYGSHHMIAGWVPQFAPHKWIPRNGGGK